MISNDEYQRILCTPFAPPAKQQKARCRSRLRGVRSAIPLLAIGLALGCTHSDAANVGAAIGHGLGIPLGVAAVSVEETFSTADDIQDANPRHQKSQPAASESRREASRSNRVAQPPRQQSSDPHYYKAEVLLKTHGPADIQSIELQDTEDVTEFWQ
jgi:hypothetical protein